MHSLEVSSAGEWSDGGSAVEKTTDGSTLLSQPRVRWSGIGRLTNKCQRGSKYGSIEHERFFETCLIFSLVKLLVNIDIYYRVKLFFSSLLSYNNL